MSLTQQQRTESASGTGGGAVQRQEGDSGPNALRSMGYSQGAAALSPRGAVQMDAEVEGDAATDRRRGAHVLDPTALPAQQADANVHNRNWADRGQLFVNGVSPQDVHQTNINDCFFVAVLASIAQEQPGYLQQIIREDGPGRYSVRFFEKVTGTNDYRQVWVSVDAWFQTTGNGANQQLTYGHSNATATDAAGTTRRELWPSVMEKAYAKFKGNYSDINWGNTTYAYEALFGTQGTRQNTGNTAAQQTAVWDQVKTALDADQPIVASTGRHVVTVLRYSEAGGGKQITIRDQAATGDGARSGERTYALADFCTTFTYVRAATVDAYARRFGGMDLAGDWNSNFGPLHLESVKQNEFNGTYGGTHPGRIPWAFQGGDTMGGTWQGDNGETGRFDLRINADRRSFAGTWGKDGSSSDGGAWTGTRS